MASTSSIGSTTNYLDIQKLVAQSLEEYSGTLNSVKAKKESYDQAKSDWSELRTALTSLKTSLYSLTLPGVFYQSSASSSDTDIVTVSASASAASTSYKLTNISLARSARQAGADLKFNDSSSYQGTKSARTSYEAIGSSVNPNIVLSDAGSGINTSPGGTACAFQAGVLIINGAAITIDPADDTLYEVMSKINSSSAGVTASLTKNGEEYSFVLQSKTAGDEDIDIESDTTNFSKIMRVDTEGSYTTGKDAFWEQTIDYVNANHPDSPLRGVKDGYFMINGINFAVDTSVDSLQSIINRINNSQAGVSVMYDKDLDYVTVTSKETGKDIEFGDDFQQGDTAEFLKNVLGLDLSVGKQTAVHTKASVDVNGVTVTPDSNTFTLNGCTFVLHDDSVTGASVDISRNTEAAQKGIENFITKYNALSDLIDEHRADDQPLKNDRLLTNIRSTLRNLVLSKIDNPGEYSFLRDIGIEYSGGKLSLDSSALANAFRDNPESVSQLFAFDGDGNGLRDEGGFSQTTIKNFISKMTLSSTGDIAQRTKYFDSRIEQANSKLALLQKSLDKREKWLWEEYTGLATASNEMSVNLQTMNSRLSELLSSS